MPKELQKMRTALSNQIRLTSSDTHACPNSPEAMTVNDEELKTTSDNDKKTFMTFADKMVSNDNLRLSEEKKSNIFDGSSFADKKSKESINETDVTKGVKVPTKLSPKKSKTKSSRSFLKLSQKQQNSIREAANLDVIDKPISL